MRSLVYYRRGRISRGNISILHNANVPDVNLLSEIKKDEPEYADDNNTIYTTI